MTTSNKKIVKPAKPVKENWTDLSATLKTSEQKRFCDWLDQELSSLESEFSQFSSPRSTRNHFAR